MVPCPPPPSPSAPPPPGGGGLRGASRSSSPLRHPDESQDPGSRAAPCLALGPDFRQDDGRQDDVRQGDGGWLRMTGNRTADRFHNLFPLEPRRSPARRGRSPLSGAGAGSARRWRDRGFVVGTTMVPCPPPPSPSAPPWRGRSARGGPPRLPGSVILTKVRTQGRGRCPAWLWVLTFVRMTGDGSG